MKKIRRLLVANRGEIAIRVFRAASELKIRTVALYTYEDRYSLHRYKADEAYQIGEKDEPLRPYLNKEEILELAREKEIDAIHPGYGFLSENVDFVELCEKAGIVFVGPTSSAMRALGDKVRAKEIARRAGVPVIEDRQVSATAVSEAVAAAQDLGFPLIIKAAAGGGGRGMRVVRNVKELESALQEASREARTAFGDETVFLERFVESPKHLEVQLLGDTAGNLVHLFERDCSVQRRFQKVVEVAPAVAVSPQARQQLWEYALKIGREVHYH
ncbi:MAG: ATP-grasp domain-containing protein, partial [Bdellovibrionales bacterium]|nr:ATP-grasp domain-containing protein [Bdellovibrionales bacterium]